MASWQENVVIERGSVSSLSCPLKSGGQNYVTWSIVRGQGVVDNINFGLEVYEAQKYRFFVNSTESSCYLYIINVDMMSGSSISCVSVETGQSMKTFHIYVMG